MRGNFEMPELRRNLGVLSNLDAGEIAEAHRISQRVEHDAICGASDLAGHSADLRHEPLPLRRDARVRFPVTLGDTRNDERLAVLETGLNTRAAHCPAPTSSLP